MSELVEEIDKINYKLQRAFGTEMQAGDRVSWRVVFANDELEQRLMSHSDTGMALIHPEVREVKKYTGVDYRGFYILERLIPNVGRLDVSGEIGTTDIVGKVTYFPAWVFRDKNHNYLPPTFDMCVFIIESVLAAANSKPGTHVKYKDPALDPEFRKKELNLMVEKLFGDESEVADALHYQQGIVVPQNYEKTSAVAEKGTVN